MAALRSLPRFGLAAADSDCTHDYNPECLVRRLADAFTTSALNLSNETQCYVPRAILFTSLLEYLRLGENPHTDQLYMLRPLFLRYRGDSATMRLPGGGTRGNRLER